MKRRKYRYFAYHVVYSSEPDTVYTYYFRAESEEEAAQATGLEVSKFYEVSEAKIDTEISRGTHIDIVRNGRLIEFEPA